MSRKLTKHHFRNVLFYAFVVVVAVAFSYLPKSGEKNPIQDYLKTNEAAVASDFTIAFLFNPRSRFATDNALNIMKMLANSDATIHFVWISEADKNPFKADPLKSGFDILPVKGHHHLMPNSFYVYEGTQLLNHWRLLTSPDVYYRRLKNIGLLDGQPLEDFTVGQSLDGSVLETLLPQDSVREKPLMLALFEDICFSCQSGNTLEVLSFVSSGQRDFETLIYVHQGLSPSEQAEVRDLLAFEASFLDGTKPFRQFWEDTRRFKGVKHPFSSKVIVIGSDNVVKAYLRNTSELINWHKQQQAKEFEQ